MSSILHMDVPSCRNTQAQIMSTKDQIEQQMNTIRSVVDSMVGSSWIAPGATQYQQNISSWAGSVTQLLSQLSELATYLAGEIDRWEAEGGQ